MQRQPGRWVGALGKSGHMSVLRHGCCMLAVFAVYAAGARCRHHVGWDALCPAKGHGMRHSRHVSGAKEQTTILGAQRTHVGCGIQDTFRVCGASMPARYVRPLMLTHCHHRDVRAASRPLPPEASEDGGSYRVMTAADGKRYACYSEAAAPPAPPKVCVRVCARAPAHVCTCCV